MKFGIENVRCFRQPHCVRIAPLTILVGENSTGKSSFMSLLRIANQIAQGDLSPDFNSEPFSLGAYEQIAHRPHGQAPAKSFRLSLSMDMTLPEVPKQTTEATFDAHFIAREGQPALARFGFNVLEFQLTIESKPGETETKVDFPSLQGMSSRISTKATKSMLLGGFLPWMASFVFEQTYRKGPESEPISEAEADQFREEAALFTWMASQVQAQLREAIYPFAPIRTRPRRTYDPVISIFQEEGAHIPTRLARMQRAKNSDADRLHGQINEFGKVSGLFNALEVKTLGNSQGDPFQIHVKVGDTYANLIDVGYGVSQALPIIVDLLEGGDESRLYLLQQPEVHLHPRAQAQLGSFLGEVVSQTQSHVVVETHSDFLVDRVRMAIRDEQSHLTSEAVSLLYFEHTGAEVKIHEIALDSLGDIVDPPESYREFFMSELRNKFGV